MNTHLESNDNNSDELISKSELKREMQRLQKLGERLCALKPSEWQALPISEHLHAALEESLRIKKHEAKRRHMQFIGRLMREQDIEAICAHLDLSDPSSPAYIQRHNVQERWRSRLLEDEHACHEFIAQNPSCDRQHLRTLIRNARKEQQMDSPASKTAQKKLFQYIKYLVN